MSTSIAKADIISASYKFYDHTHTHTHTDGEMDFQK